MKKLLFLFFALCALGVSAQNASKENVLKLFNANGKTEHYTNLLKGKNVDTVLDEVATVYTQFLSDTDVKALTAFYNTEVGQRIAHPSGRGSEEDQKAYKEFMKTSAMQNYMHSIRKIGIKENEIQKKWLQTSEK